MTENFKQMISKSSFCPAENIAGSDDLLKEILLRLPASSVLRFSCVSHRWRSFISDPYFRQLHSRRSSAITDGLFLFRKSDKKYHLDHLFNFSDTSKRKVVPSNIRTFTDSFRSVEPLHCCNGLLCLKLLQPDNDDVLYCVYNPRTNRHTNIPLPDINDEEEIVSMNLAFDPKRSSNYKIICIVKERLGFLRWLTFSNNWKESGQGVRVRGEYYFGKGVFLNGTIYWTSKHSAFVCFDMDNDSLKIMPSTSVPEGRNGRKIKYFGESAGNLHLIEENVLRSTLLNVFELENDYSNWYVKYVVDVDDLTRLFPLMVINEPESLDVIGYQFDVLCFVDGEKDGKTMLVLSLPEKMISYDIKNMSIKELLNVQLEELHLSIEGFIVYNYKWYHAYKHVETLALV
ncbi:F-box protein At5g07610-like [Nicotiana sylvestris]|uniref:F-box protein At5g07610-like n=1 Tax=Nicotiana sylvestris TaxID=4096 RepID=A0A1U7YIR4_NICSY|nr:PREDICTED: F-box protein At5g07610-like [Nicotiana sylvestris]